MSDETQSNQSPTETKTELEILTQKIESLETALVEAQENTEQAKENHRRALADLQNFQRREAENKQFWSQMAVTEFLKKVLPCLLELTLGAEHTQDEAIKKVIEKFNNQMNDLGVEKINPTMGEVIDPEQHEVLLTATGEPGTIAQTLEPGWKYQHKVLVPAKVSAVPN